MVPQYHLLAKSSLSASGSGGDITGCSPSAPAQTSAGQITTICHFYAERSTLLRLGEAYGFTHPEHSSLSTLRLFQKGASRHQLAQQAPQLRYLCPPVVKMSIALESRVSISSALPLSACNSGSMSPVATRQLNQDAGPLAL